MAFNPDQHDPADRNDDYVPDPPGCDGSGWLDCRVVHSYCGGANPDCDVRECAGCPRCEPEIECPTCKGDGRNPEPDYCGDPDCYCRTSGQGVCPTCDGEGVTVEAKGR